MERVGVTITPMQIVLSAHFDIARPVPFITLDEGCMKGLVDNFAGVFASWEAHKKTGVPLYLTNFEETGFKGAREVAKKIDKNTLVIVVDTTRDAGKFPAYIGNAYNFDPAPLKKKFAKDIFFMPGYFEETEDETWIYGHEMGLYAFYFGVPIPYEKDYHATDNMIELRAINKSADVLSRLIEELLPKRS